MQEVPHHPEGAGTVPSPRQPAGHQVAHMGFPNSMEAIDGIYVAILCPVHCNSDFMNHQAFSSSCFRVNGAPGIAYTQSNCLVREGPQLKGLWKLLSCAPEDMAGRVSLQGSQH